MFNKNPIKMPKWAYLLNYIKSKDNPPMIRLARKVDLTYPHALLIINIMEYKKWITTTKEGRDKKIELTELGLEVKSNIDRVVELI